ncbi:MAG: DUF1499 domain-containing protein [Synechococcales cyanobacterium CRU_2_2]|nr:DUF1499 domain-containing protein [Synechococcales cyanobacterium CRU_2_2]
MRLMPKFLVTIGLTLTLCLSLITPACAAIFSFAGDRPSNLGITAGQLAPCPATPNCVSSQATDAHRIAPLAYTGDGAAAIAKVKAAIVASPGSKIITEAENYVYAEFSSGLMGFVDDVEFYRDDAAGVIQVRSASRLGESDLGVNAKRIEAIRSAM